MRHATLVLFALALGSAGLTAQATRQVGGRPAGPPLPDVPVTAAMSSSDLATALDAYIARLAAAGEFAGVVLVARDGQPILEKAYGIADRERGVAMTPDLRFNLASIGKAFTKTAIGQLVGQGKLALTDTVGKVLPDYPNPNGKAATIEQLLNHTGGVADFFGERFDAADKSQFRANADYFRFVAPQPLLFEPGTRNQYCNGCYIVLGQIVEQVSGETYEHYVSEHVFKPAGMTGAGFLGYGDDKVAPGYVREGSAYASNVTFHGLHGSAAGGVYGRAADLLAFDNALRERRLLDARMTAWYLGGAETTAGRAPGNYGIAGGAKGANADLEAEGPVTVAVVGNLDPPNAVRLGAAISRALRPR